MMLNTPPNVPATLSRLSTALRQARKALGRDNSDQFGKEIGVSGRTLRVLEASGKGSVENLIRVLMAICPNALDDLIEYIESVEPPYASVDEALEQKPARRANQKPSSLGSKARE
ncbi:hypothetical protein SAMN02745866_02514 [Alteromonadaceae bacterium Bs31]|nr:hypothetical protein SAMN02745866_02514 [Alteromonadaceae bacterium Bs31]